MEDAIEYAHVAPEDKTIIQSFVRDVFAGSVPPLQAVPDDVYDAAEHPHIISSRNAMRTGKKRSDAFDLPVGKIKKLCHYALRGSNVHASLPFGN